MTSIKNTLTAGLLLALSGACSTGGESVEKPTWVKDIRPIIQANCLRCHTPPSIGGAPTDFRLDVYADTTLANGRVIRGAYSMARFIAIRAGESGTMPPDSPRSDGQRDSLINWWESGAPVGENANNRLPRAKLLSELAEADTEPVTLKYEVRDIDGDLVSGSLRVGDRLVSETLINGRGTATVLPATFEDGDYPIVATLSDDLRQTERTLGTLVVRHDNGNTAPHIELVDSRQEPLSLYDALITDAQLPMELGIRVADPDIGDSLQFDLVAFRGDDEVTIEQGLAVTTGENSYSWDDTSDIPEGPGWRLRITVSDGTASTEYESGRFFVSHQRSDLAYADVEDLFVDACLMCHQSARIPGLDALDFVAPEDARAQANALRGRIYRRVILEGTMPPVSAEAMAQSTSLPWRPLSPEERSKLAEYLLGGSLD